MTAITSALPGSSMMQVLRNPEFNDVGTQPLRSMQSGTAIWGDFDAAGRLDILSAGADTGIVSDPHTDLLLNLADGFGRIEEGLPASLGLSASGDFDNDGDPDIALGLAFGDVQVWRNTGGRFTNSAGLSTSFGASSADWGDYDNDGKLDLLLTGNFVTQAVAQVWRNVGTGFSNIGVGLPAIAGSAAWGDYDNDGLLDILLMGTTNFGDPSGGSVQVWRNNGNGFSNIDAGLPAIAFGKVAWGDYDNDGRLDILLYGTNYLGSLTNKLVTQIWRNNSAVTNTPPSPPTGLGLSHTASGTVLLSWNPANDAQTPSNGLSYNVRIGTAPGGIDIVSPMSLPNGQRLIPQRGSAQTCLTFKPTPGITYYWSVQAIDTAFAGSPFSAEASFAFHGTLGSPGSTTATPGDIDGDGIVSQSELAAVLAKLNGNGILSESDLQLILTNYFSYSPFLQMTNVAGLGGTNVTFALTNSLSGAFSVEFTTNFLDWYFLGPATPRYLFTDTNAPAVPQRYYRLRWP